MKINFEELFEEKILKKHLKEYMKEEYRKACIKQQEEQDLLNTMKQIDFHIQCMIIYKKQEI